MDNTAKMKLCREIVHKLDSTSDGVMQQDELKIIVKHLDPTFINVPTNQIQIEDPKLKALIGKETEALVLHLSDTYDGHWIQVFHQFLGLGNKSTEFAASKPGVYTVSWFGGIRYRTEPDYQSIADEEEIALPQTQYEVREFITGEDGLEYAYLYWARYFLPTRFNHGEAMLTRIAEPSTPAQVSDLARDLFREIAENEPVGWEQITNFLDGADIAYNKVALRNDFKRSGTSNEGTLGLDEFIAAVKRGAISDILCIPTRNRQTIPHYPGVKQRVP